MSRKKTRIDRHHSPTDRRRSRAERLRPLAGLLAIGLTAPAFADPSVPFPTYQTGPQPDGSWVVGDGQIVNPAGIQVDLGIRVRAKAIALNPNTATHTAAVLVLGASQAVVVFNTQTGQVVQNYAPFGDSSGSYSGIAYSADGKYLMFSQDSSNVAVANVLPSGLLTDLKQVSVPPNNSFIQCFPNSPIGDYGRPCGTFYTTNTSYPGGVALSVDGKSAYALLNQNNTLAKIDLTTLTQGTQIRVGNAPHSIVIKEKILNGQLVGETAYISNEGGRAATQADFQVYSAGTPIVADNVNGSATTGTVSVVDLPTMQVTATISAGIGLHPTGMALFGDALLVLNTYSDSISVVDTATNKVMRTIDLGLPIKVPGQSSPAYGAGPNAIAVDPTRGIAYVALYNANAIAVVDLSGGATQPVLGLIPVAYAPASVVLDTADNALLVANDKGIGTRFSFETDYGKTSYNTHQDNGTVSIVPVPGKTTLASMTKQVYQYNHWDLQENIAAAGGGSPSTPAVPIPAHIGDPSLIKHVFLIIRENRTYDQVLGDVKAGNGDPGLTVFGKRVTPNMHNIVTRFPLFDNFYDPSRQSADGHQWIVEGMAPYADDIQSPDWVRSYPGGNAGDALAYQKKGFLFQEAVAAGLQVKIYGEYVENEFFPTPLGHPTWSQFYADSQRFEAGQEATLQYQNAIAVESSIPVVSNHLIKNFPQFDLNIPDQFRVDLWVQDFNNDLQNGTVPALSILWIMDDHTGGPPSADAEQADNDLAVGRIIDYISHSNVWDSSAIFIEEDDAQNGVDHVDGHRSPGYVVSPYAVQHGPTDHSYYTQVNMTRTIEQILGLPPMNQFDLVASPMRTAFVTGIPPKAAFAPFDHLKNNVALDKGVKTSSKTPLTKLARAWKQMKIAMFAGKTTKPDSVDVDTLSHLDWYEATNFKRPYPGEKKVRWPAEFAARVGLPKTDSADADD
jgi:YVTN family beta-propeller protein